jgi:hypothetical protein
MFRWNLDRFLDPGEVRMGGSVVLFLASGSPLGQSGLPAKCQIVCGGVKLNFERA